MIRIEASMIAASTTRGFALADLTKDGGGSYIVVFRDDANPLFYAIQSVGDASPDTLARWTYREDFETQRRAFQFWCGLRVIENDPVLKSHYKQLEDELLQLEAESVPHALTAMAYYNTEVFVAIGKRDSQGIRTIDRIFREAREKRKS